MAHKKKGKPSFNLPIDSSLLLQRYGRSHDYCLDMKRYFEPGAVTKRSEKSTEPIKNSDLIDSFRLRNSLVDVIVHQQANVGDSERSKN